MGIKEKIKKIIINYLCCGIRREEDVKKIYDEISQIDDDFSI